MNPDVDWFFEKKSKWQCAFEELRTIVLDCGLTEELKWGCPCYTYQKKNIILVHGFKYYCALLFMKGLLLKEDKKILVQQTANVQAARQSKTRKARIEKYILKILEGKGLEDYKTIIKNGTENST